MLRGQGKGYQLVRATRGPQTPITLWSGVAPARPLAGCATVDISQHLFPP